MLCTHVQGVKKKTCEHILLDTLTSACVPEQRNICRTAKALHFKTRRAYFVESAEPYQMNLIMYCPFTQRAVECQCGIAIDADGSIKILLTCIHKAILTALYGRICSSHTCIDAVNYLLVLFTGEREAI